MKKEDIFFEESMEEHKKKEQHLLNMLEERNSEIEKLSCHLRNMKRQRDLLIRVEESNQKLKEEVRILNKCLQLNDQQLSIMQAKVDAITTSTSWKITAPLRKMMDKVRDPLPSANVTVLTVEEITDESTIAFEPSTVESSLFKASEVMPESIYFNREDPEILTNKLIEYDVISFDIFDTLVLRIFDNPTDVFRALGHRLGLESFEKMRLLAESRAREIHSDVNGEVNIYEIYDVLHRYLRINKEEVIKEELQIEKECCFANSYFRKILESLRALNKEIIIVSDSYLPSNMLEELLNSCGYAGCYDHVYSSCDYRHGKRNGELYKLILKDYPDEKKFVHIGPNKKSDFERSRENGWNSIWYRSNQEIGVDFRLATLDRLSTSVYRSLVNAQLHADETIYSIAYEHGFRFAGFLVCGFCEWLNRYANENKIEKILFMARDCDIIYKVYNQFFKEVDNEYLITSRLAMWEMSFESNPEEFIQNFFWTRANQTEQSLEVALEDTDLKFLVPFLEGEGLSPGSILTVDNFDKIHEFLLRHYEDIVKHFARSKEAGKKYLMNIIGEAKRICAVDVGWSGQILVLMKKLLSDFSNQNVELTGAYMAVTSSAITTGLVESGLITPYLFSGCMNRDVAINTDSLVGEMQMKFVEATFTSDQPTLLKYDLTEDGNVNLVYGFMNCDPEKVHDIQSGVLDFASMWKERTNPIKSYIQIMPSDAMKILNMALSDFQYCYSLFGDNKEWEVALPNFDGYKSITTLGDMLNKRGLIQTLGC